MRIFYTPSVSILKYTLLFTVSFELVNATAKTSHHPKRMTRLDAVWLSQIEDPICLTDLKTSLSSQLVMLELSNFDCGWCIHLGYLLDLLTQ